MNSYRGKKAGHVAAMLAAQVYGQSPIVFDELSQYIGRIPFRLKPFTVQLYLHTGIGAFTFGAIRPIPAETLEQVSRAVERLPMQVRALQWVTRVEVPQWLGQ